MNDWRALGACHDQPAHWWFPDTGDIDNRAAAVCADCPVLLECRAWGLHHEDAGIWGGLSEKERRRIRRQQHISLRVVAPDDDSWKRPRAAYLFRQGWTAGQIATELRAEVRSVHRWLNAEGHDAYPPPMGEQPAGGMTHKSA